MCKWEIPNPRRLINTPSLRAIHPIPPGGGVGAALVEDVIIISIIYPWDGFVFACRFLGFWSAVDDKSQWEAVYIMHILLLDEAALISA